MTFTMPLRIFFSWQSDTPNAVGRTMIEACLERAIGTLQADAEIDLADRELSVDKDTLHVPGSPPAVAVAVKRAWHRRKLAALSDRQLRDAGIDLSAAGRGKAAAVSAATLWRLQALTHG
jgi:hypothetical protein